MEPYTAALTSCGRFSFLERTLRSFLSGLDGRVVRILIIEGGGSRAIFEVIGPYANWGMHPGVARIAQAYRNFGYLLTCLAEPAVRHIGDGRHMRDPFRLTGFSHAMVRSVRKRLLRLRGKLTTDKRGQ